MEPTPNGCSNGTTALSFAAASQREFRQEGPHSAGPLGCNVLFCWAIPVDDFGLRLVSVEKPHRGVPIDSEGDSGARPRRASAGTDFGESTPYVRSIQGGKSDAGPERAG